MRGIIFVDHEGLMALADPGWELGGEPLIGPKLPPPEIPREIPHECGKDGSHFYNCGDCGWLPF